MQRSAAPRLARSRRHIAERRALPCSAAPLRICTNPARRSHLGLLRGRAPREPESPRVPGRARTAQLARRTTAAPSPPFSPSPSSSPSPVVFLERLQAYPALPHAHIQHLRALYGFARTPNAELRWRFYEVALLDPVSPAAREFAPAAAHWVVGADGSGVVRGRMKFCRPTFRAVARADRPPFLVHQKKQGQETVLFCDSSELTPLRNQLSTTCVR